MTTEKRKILLFIMPIICIVIAGIQLYLSKTTALSLWKGGGFGMYTELHPNNARSIWLDLGDKQVSFTALKENLNLSLKAKENSTLISYVQAQVRELRYYPTKSKLELLKNDLQKILVLAKSDVVIRDIYMVELKLDTSTASYTAKRVDVP